MRYRTMVLTRDHLIPSKLQFAIPQETRDLMKNLCLIVALIVHSIASSAAWAQKNEKDWTKWTKKEAEKVLSNSPWSQNQTDTDMSEMFFSPTSDPNKRPGPPTQRDEDRLVKGATNQSVNVKFVIRFFSARPVRQALMRLLELENNPSPEVLTRMRDFANFPSNDIIITVLTESTDQRSGRAVMQLFHSAVTGTLKNDTYLERNGKRLFLGEYVPPGKDGFGARFVFKRLLDEKPFIADNSGEVRFYSKFDKGPKIDRRFKVAEMMYNGDLEY
jgi:hypothetical protein